jgi:hypothetical protein
MSTLPNPSSHFNAFCALRRLCMGVCFLVFIAPRPVLARQSSNAQTAKPAAPVPPSVQTDAKKAAATPRQAQIIADTQKLVKLSEELKAEVAKSSKDTLSLTVIKKAEEVEKLAKTLKEELNKTH